MEFVFVVQAGTGDVEACVEYDREFISVLLMRLRCRPEDN